MIVEEISGSLHRASTQGLFQPNGRLQNSHVSSRKSRRQESSSSEECSNYRQIPLLSIISLLIDRFVYNQLQSHLQTFNLQSETQRSLMAKRSTEDLLLHICQSYCAKLSKSPLFGHRTDVLVQSILF